MHIQSTNKIPTSLKDVSKNEIHNLISDKIEKVLDLDGSFFKNQVKTLSMYFNPNDFELIKNENPIPERCSHGSFFIKCCVDNHLPKGEQYIMLDYIV
jgi:hypothetical protein